MTDAINIVATCQTARAGGLAIDLGPRQGGEISPADPRFETVCRRAFQEAIARQKLISPGREPQIWTSGLIQTAADYIKKHGLKAALLGSEHPSGMQHGRMSVEYETVFLNFLYVPLSGEELLLGLDHEFGHVRDDKLFQLSYPRDYKDFMESEVTRELNIRYCEARLKHLAERMSTGEKNRFRALASSVFGDFNDLSSEDLDKARRIITEILREGEEVYDRRKTADIWNHPDYFLTRRAEWQGHRGFIIRKKGGLKINLKALLFTAHLQEAGVWEAFTARKDLPPMLVRAFAELPIFQDQIDFFRMGIRAATHYFPVIGPPKPVSPEAPR